MKLFAYLRISTDKQDEASQRQIITSAALDNPGAPLEWIYDTASGGTPWQQRGIAHALGKALAGDTIIVSEVSRIARSTIGVLTFLQAATEKGVLVVAVKTGIKLDGSMQSKIVVTVLGLAAEIERDLLRARTKAALDARKLKCKHGAATGKPCKDCAAADGLAIAQKIGRQPGARGKHNKLAGKGAEIQTLLDKKISKAGIARLLNVSRQTLDTFLNLTVNEH